MLLDLYLFLYFNFTMAWDMPLGNQNYEHVAADVFVFVIPVVFVVAAGVVLFLGSSLFRKCTKCTEGPIIS